MLDADDVSNLRAKFPNIPSEPLMAHAYVDCLHWALGCGPILEQYRAETGNKWTPGRTPLDRMIDDATGAGLGFIKAFVPWFDANVWGPEEGGAGG